MLPFTALFNLAKICQSDFRAVHFSLIMKGKRPSEGVCIIISVEIHSKIKTSGARNDKHNVAQQ